MWGAGGDEEPAANEPRPADPGPARADFALPQPAPTSPTPPPVPGGPPGPANPHSAAPYPAAPYPATPYPPPPYAPAPYPQPSYGPPAYPQPPSPYQSAPHQPPYPQAPAPYAATQYAATPYAAHQHAAMSYAPTPYAPAPYPPYAAGPGPGGYPPGHPAGPPRRRTDPGLPMPVEVRPVPGTPFMVAVVGIAPTTSGRAVASLVAGLGSIIVSLVVGCFGVLGGQDGWGAKVAGAFALLALFAGVASVVLGRMATREIRRVRAAERPRGRGIALAGLICGATGIGLTVLSFLLALFLTDAG